METLEISEALSLVIRPIPSFKSYLRVLDVSFGPAAQCCGWHFSLAQFILARLKIYSGSPRSQFLSLSTSTSVRSQMCTDVLANEARALQWTESSGVRGVRVFRCLYLWLSFIISLVIRSMKCGFGLFQVNKSPGSSHGWLINQSANTRQGLRQAVRLSGAPRRWSGRTRSCEIGVDFI